MENLIHFLTAGSVIFGFLSAGAWLGSTYVKVSAEKAEQILKKQSPDGMTPAQIIRDDGSDLEMTMSRQSKWNAAGALFAAVSIACQALNQLIPFI